MKLYLWFLLIWLFTVCRDPTISLYPKTSCWISEGKAEHTFYQAVIVFHYCSCIFQCWPYGGIIRKNSVLPLIKYLYVDESFCMCVCHLTVFCVWFDLQMSECYATLTLYWWYEAICSTSPTALTMLHSEFELKLEVVIKVSTVIPGDRTGNFAAIGHAISKLLPTPFFLICD